MELIQGTHKASKFEPQDFISNMPENVVTNIMDRLPLQDAVRTSKLSRNWRLKWTMLSQLVFDMNFLNYLLVREDRHNIGSIISRLLLHIKGSITKFVLYINYPASLEDISHWVLFLSRKGIEDLTLRKEFRPQLKLPTHLFSCLELKHLKLVNCCFEPLTSFHGFPNLLSLELDNVQFESERFGELCPALESLKVASPFRNSKVKPAEIGKHANLKTLSLFLCNLENIGSNSIFELVGFLPKLQELHLDFMSCEPTEGDAKRSPLTTFPCIKTLKLSTVDLGNRVMLSYAFEMIRSFSNLQTLEITASERVTVPTPGICFSEVDYNTTGSLQLCSVVFRDLKGSVNEVCLITYLLTCSPVLKKLVIEFRSHLKPGEQLLFAGKLLKLQRAYPAVDIDLY
ncbi:hypothetical protein SSX86_002086 [Deinandra increscens subsp. villosa]|uniref:F-box domain-containing protein n=1 Tax=Deinandra increscens subsp. villosa TaxID=3103831 RepID=A0AAP0H9B1_9ASTR